MPDTSYPGPEDAVNFQVGVSSYTVTFPGNQLVNDGGFGFSLSSIASYKSRRLRVRDSGVVFSGSTDPQRGASTYTITEVLETETERGIIIGIDAGENARLSLSHPTLFGGGLTSLSSAAATLGQNAGSTGTLNVGFGKFDVTGSDIATFSTDLSHLTVGHLGTGNLNVTGGADVNVLGFNGRATIGLKPGSVGNVKISGVGSTWTVANLLDVGMNGTGALTVQNGGSLVTNGTGGTPLTAVGVLKDPTSGAAGRGSITVTGAGSTWTNSAPLHVGGSGNGELIIANGGRFITTNNALATVGGNVFGIATVTGPGSSWVTPSAIHIQGAGQGALHIRNGGSVTAGRILMRGIEQGSNEIFVSDAGSTLNVTNSLVIGKPGSQFDTGRSTLVINPGARVDVALDVDLHRNGVLKLQGGTLAAASIGSTAVSSGLIQGAFEWTSGTLHAGEVHSTSLINQAGKLAPGLPIGRTAIPGNYSQLAGASMEIEIGGPVAATEHDFVSLDGSASLNGALELALVNSFRPTPDQAFTILESQGGITGAFSNVANGQRLATVDHLGTFQVNYGAGSTFDPNKVVLSDFLLDFGRDFLDRQRRFGEAPTRAAAIGGVPEPSAAILGCLAALGAAAAGRSGRAARRECC